MKTASPALVALLNGSSNFQVADLYDITLADSTVLRYTNADRPIVYSGNTYGTQIGFKRDGVRLTARPQVDALNLTLFVDDSVLYGTIPYQRTLARAAHDGLFDGARVKLYRAFFDSTGALVGALVHFEGTVADVNPTGTSIAMSVKSELEKLNQQLPKNIFQAGCNHAFLDKGCDPSGSLRAASTVSGTLAGGQSDTQVQIAGNYGTNYFLLGVVYFTSGPNQSLRRAVRSSQDAGANHIITLTVPFPTAGLVGDTAIVTRGCDRSLATCQAFGNEARFRGFPFVPRPEDGVGAALSKKKKQQ